MISGLEVISKHTSLKVQSIPVGFSILFRAEKDKIGRESLPKSLNTVFVGSHIDEDTQLVFSKSLLCIARRHHFKIAALGGLARDDKSGYGNVVIQGVQQAPSVVSEDSITKKCDPRPGSLYNFQC